MLRNHCITLKNGKNAAWICAEKGANCVRLRLNGAEVLRTPPSWHALCLSPHVYGVPLLLPPNRIANGSFTWQGQTYRLPANEPMRGNHIHGALADAAFQVVSRTANTVTLRYCTAEGSIYAAQGWDFCLEITYVLSETGLEQTLCLRNGETPLPLGLGCHTTLNAPFLRGDPPEAMRLRAPAKAEWVLERRRVLPTGERTVSPLCAALQTGDVTPCAQPLSALFTLDGSTVELRSQRTRCAVRYELEGFPFLMVWNQGGSRSFVCCEPQTWVVDAPHVNLAPEETGFLPFAPKETRVFRTRLSLMHGL